jgi:hypothetical protein
MGSLRNLKNAKPATGRLTSRQTHLCIRASNQPSGIYLIDRGHLRHISDRYTLYNLYGDGYVPKDIKAQFFPKLPVGRPLEPGAHLVRCLETDEIFLAAPELKVIRPISQEHLNDYGFSLTKLRIVARREDLPVFLGEALQPK